MSKLGIETVLSVHHWNDSLFSFTTTRDQGLRFENGHFVMIGLEIDNKPLTRAYSIASANYDNYLEFFSIKVQDGALTSRLQEIKAGDCLLVSKKPTGTLTVHDLLPGKNLYMLATGTGLAPFLSVIKDPEIYDRFDKVVLVHGVRKVDEFAYYDYLKYDLFKHEYIGDVVREKFIYYPTATREPYINNGRITDLIATGKLSADIGLPDLNSEVDRVMICGNQAMLTELSLLLNSQGFSISPGVGRPGDYVIERAFVES